MTGKKMGRPTDSPRINNTRIRMSDEEVEKLNICCQKTGMTKADIIRLGIQLVYEKVQK